MALGQLMLRPRRPLGKSKTNLRASIFYRKYLSTSVYVIFTTVEREEEEASLAERARLIQSAKAGPRRLSLFVPFARDDDAPKVLSLA